MRGRAAVQLAEQYRRMVAKAGWQVWHELPKHTQSWVSPEDIITEGMEWVVTELIPKWRKQEASLSTLLYPAIWRHFDTEYRKYFSAQQRDESAVVAMEDWVKNRAEDYGKRVEYVIPALRDQRTAEEILVGCWAVPLVVRVHKRASRNLRSEMGKWFLGSSQARVHLSTAQFWQARQEFLGLAGHEGLGISECRHLFQSPKCLGELHRVLQV